VEFLHLEQALEAIPKLGRFGAGIVVDTLEFLDKRHADQLIARLRDLHTSRFCALVPIGDGWEGRVSHWRSADLLSYGMKLVNDYQTDP
jgi:hypothetical protein